MKQTLGKPDRIKRRKDLQRVFRQGRSASDRLITLHVVPGRADRPRMAVTVSTRHGKAVHRNRIKRLCREAYRACRADLPGGYDYVLRPKIGAELDVDAIGESLRKLAARLTKGGTP